MIIKDKETFEMIKKYVFDKYDYLFVMSRLTENLNYMCNNLYVQMNTLDIYFEDNKMDIFIEYREDIEKWLRQKHLFYEVQKQSYHDNSTGFNFNVKLCYSEFNIKLVLKLIDYIIPIGIEMKGGIENVFSNSMSSRQGR